MECMIKLPCDIYPLSSFVRFYTEDDFEYGGKDINLMGELSNGKVIMLSFLEESDNIRSDVYHTSAYMDVFRNTLFNLINDNINCGILFLDIEDMDKKFIKNNQANPPQDSDSHSEQS